MKAIRIWRTCFINVRARDSSLFYIKAIKVSRVERAGSYYITGDERGMKK